MALARRNSLVLGACIFGLLGPTLQAPAPQLEGYESYQPEIYEVNFQNVDQPPSVYDVIEKIRNGEARQLFSGVDDILEIVPADSELRRFSRNLYSQPEFYQSPDLVEENYKPGDPDSYYAGRKRIRVGSAYLIG